MKEVIQKTKGDRASWPGTKLQKTGLQSFNWDQAGHPADDQPISFTNLKTEMLSSRQDSHDETATYSTWFMAGHNVRI